MATKRKGHNHHHGGQHNGKGKAINVKALEDSIREMFPHTDVAILQTVLQDNHFDAEAAIVQLMQLQEEEEAQKKKATMQPPANDNAEDALVARKLARQLRREEAKKRKAQEKEDAEFARKLAEGLIDLDESAGDEETAEEAEEEEEEGNATTDKVEEEEEEEEEKVEAQLKPQRKAVVNCKEEKSNKQSTKEQGAEGGGSTEETSLLFVCEMFPDLSRDVVLQAFNENDQDMEKTSEHLLSLIAMKTDGDIEDEVQEQESIHQPNETIEIPKRKRANSNSNKKGGGKDNNAPSTTNKMITIEAQPQKAPSNFTQNLKLLADMFPDLERPTLAMALEQNGDDLSKTIELLLSEKDDEPEAPHQQPHTTGEAPKQPALSRGNRRISREKNKTKQLTWGDRPNQALKQIGVSSYVNYVPSAEMMPAEPPPLDVDDIILRERAYNLSTKIKFKQLQNKFPWIDQEVLESVFHYNKYNLSDTISAMCDLYAVSAHPPRPPIVKMPAVDPRPKPQPKPKTPITEIVDPVDPKTPTKPALTPEERAAKLAARAAEKQRRKEAKLAEKWTEIERKPRQPKTVGSVKLANPRLEALRLGEKRKKYAMLASQAYRAGDHAAAREYSRRATALAEKYNEAATQAVAEVFEKPSGELYQVDLHKLHLHNAMQIFERLILYHEEQRMGGTRWITVITGKGLHSTGGVPRIKPAVIHWCIDNGYHHRDNGGVVVVTVGNRGYH